MESGTRYTLRLERSRINDEDCDGASYETINASYFLSDHIKESMFFESCDEEITNVLLDMLAQRLRVEVEERSKLDGSRH